MSLLGSLLDAVPVEPDRGTARRLLVDELSRREYQEARPGPIERGLQWLWDRFQELIGGTGGGGSVTGTLVVLAVVLVVVGWAVWRAGGLRRDARTPAEAALADPTVSAAEYRSQADAAADAGDWDAAVVARFRAVARALEEQAVLTPQSGRTAREIATEAGRAVPSLAGELAAGARAFDDVLYGHLHVTAEQDGALRALDERLRTVRTAAPGSPS